MYRINMGLIKSGVNYFHDVSPFIDGYALAINHVEVRHHIDILGKVRTAVIRWY